uniref:Bm14230 n=1 Tax=Brugia malayi TaxID=6279 RepID=A0A1I9G316_BRUMA|nr:Bm14230 [Brugia malayi]
MMLNHRCHPNMAQRMPLKCPYSLVMSMLQKSKFFVIIYKPICQ